MCAASRPRQRKLHTFNAAIIIIWLYLGCLGRRLIVFERQEECRARGGGGGEKGGERNEWATCAGHSASRNIPTTSPTGHRRLPSFPERGRNLLPTGRQTAPKTAGGVCVRGVGATHVIAGIGPGKREAPVSHRCQPAHRPERPTPTSSPSIPGYRTIPSHDTELADQGSRSERGNRNARKARLRRVLALNAVTSGHSRRRNDESGEKKREEKIHTNVLLSVL